LKRADISIDFPVVSVSSQSSAREEVEDGGTLPVEVVKKTKKGPKTLNIPGVKVSDLIRTKLVEPPVKLERIYKGAHLEAEIQPDGTIVFDGETYRPLSLAASYARKSIIGAPEGRKYPQTNGWVFWKYHDPRNVSEPHKILSGKRKEARSIHRTHGLGLRQPHRGDAPTDVVANGLRWRRR
jgi:hypothetical protein